MKEHLVKKNGNLVGGEIPQNVPNWPGRPPAQPKKSKKILGPKGPWAQFWAQGRRQPLKFDWWCVRQVLTFELILEQLSNPMWPGLLQV